MYLQLIFGPETEYELAPGETPIEPIVENEPQSKIQNSTSNTKIVITKGKDIRNTYQGKDIRNTYQGKDIRNTYQGKDIRNTYQFHSIYISNKKKFNIFEEVT
jgi:hypothetical protein